MSDLVRVKSKSSRKKLKLITPIPPSINHIYYNTKYGGKRLTKDAEKWIREVRGNVHAQIEDIGWKKEALGVWMIFDMTFYFPDKRIRDNHNAFKILFDALEGIVYVNDYYVLPRVQGCYLDRENPRLEITVYPQKILIDEVSDVVTVMKVKTPDKTTTKVKAGNKVVKKTTKY